MENLSSNVTRIQSSLYSARQRFNNLDANAKETIETEVTDIRTSLQDGSVKVQHTIVQIRSHLSQIEDVVEPNKAAPTALPQIEWLSQALDSIVASLDDAQASADRALLCTTQYTYSVLDVGQEVEAESDKLNQCQSIVEGMADQAKSSLRYSEEVLKEAQAKVNAKEEEIQRKTREANEKRTRKTQLESEITQKNTEIAATERRRESKKGSAAAGLVCSIPSQIPPVR